MVNLYQGRTVDGCWRDKRPSTINKPHKEQTSQRANFTKSELHKEQTSQRANFTKSKPHKAQIVA